MVNLSRFRIFSKSEPEVTVDKTRSAAGSEFSTTPSSTRSSVRQQCDIFSITNEPAAEFFGPPAPVPPSVKLCWRLLALQTLAHACLLLVNIVLLFSVDHRERKSHQQVLLFSLLMLTNIVVVLVLGLVVVRQNKAITQAAICCTFWTAFAYFVILAYNSLDDPLSLTAGRTCLTVIIMTILELATLSVYFVLRFIRYKKVVELYNCRACTCEKECASSRTPTKLSMNDLWGPKSENDEKAPHVPSAELETPSRSIKHESPLSDTGKYTPSTHYM